MKYLLLNIAFFVLLKSYSQTNETTPYLDQFPPGIVPEIFAAGLLSTEANEFNASFTTNIDMVYFTENTNDGQRIMVIEKLNGIWQKRKQASFSDKYRDVDPFVSYDDNKIYFSSNRPTKNNISKKDCDFWYVQKLPSGKWSEAIHIDNPCNNSLDDFYYVKSKIGNIYYSVFQNNDKGDIFCLMHFEQKILSKKLSPPINTIYNEHDPFIAPDESYLIFASDRPGGYGNADLYICFKDKNDIWNAPINMGEKINSNKYDYCPILSPDEKYLFFSSYREGNSDVFWVDAKIINLLKPEIKQ